MKEQPKSHDTQESMWDEVENYLYEGVGDPGKLHIGRKVYEKFKISRVSGEAKTPDLEGDKISELVKAEYEKGNIVIATEDGLSTAKLEDFLNQPVDGILYDLNRGEEVTLTFINDPKWVNDYAVAKVIRTLVSKLKTGGSVPTPSDEPQEDVSEKLTANEVIERFCKLQEKVSIQIIGYEESADCFCRKGGFWGRNGEDAEFALRYYRNSGFALRFIEKTVDKAIKEWLRSSTEQGRKQ